MPTKYSTPDRTCRSKSPEDDAELATPVGAAGSHENEATKRATRAVRAGRWHEERSNCTAHSLAIVDPTAAEAEWGCLP